MTAGFVTGHADKIQGLVDAAGVSSPKSAFHSRVGVWQPGAMDIPRLADARWATVAPLLPPRRPRPKGGRPFADARETLATSGSAVTDH